MWPTLLNPIIILQCRGNWAERIIIFPSLRRGTSTPVLDQTMLILIVVSRSSCKLTSSYSISIKLYLRHEQKRETTVYFTIDSSCNSKSQNDMYYTECTTVEMINIIFRCNISRFHIDIFNKNVNIYYANI